MQALRRSANSPFSVPYVPMDQVPTPLFEERIGPSRRAWMWFPIVCTVTLFALAPLAVPIAVLAWFVNVVRYRKAAVRIDPDYLWVGRRWVRLAALDLTTMGRAGNTWPWRAFNSRYLGANPIWTNDSVAVRGIDGGRPYWVAAGTNHREELVSVLREAVPAAKERAQAAGTWSPIPRLLPPPAWHPDPWDPAGHLRWWDGHQWTGYTVPHPSDERGTP